MRRFGNWICDRLMGGMLPLAAVCAAFAPAALEARPDEPSAVVTLMPLEGSSDSVGIIRFRDSAHGLVAEPQLSGLLPGPHGLHLHAGSSCVEPGTHYDPARTDAHRGPFGEGHLGDLPNLIVEQDGKALIPVLAPRLKASHVIGRAVMIHAGADRYATPAHGHGDHHASAQAAGGSRLFCGIAQRERTATP